MALEILKFENYKNKKKFLHKNNHLGGPYIMWAREGEDNYIQLLLLLFGC